MGSEKERKKVKEHQKKMETLHQQEREKKLKFQKEVEKIIAHFVNSEDKRFKMKPMNKLSRTVVHEIAEDAGLLTQAFGREEQDRYILLIKKDHPLTDDEMEAYKRGEEWNEEKAEEVKQQKAQERLQKQQLEEEEKKEAKIKPVEPKTNYKDKYHHIIGKVAAKDAAVKTTANSSFGMVPSNLKRDQRSIEETLSDIKKKRRKPEQDTTTTS